MLATSRKQNLPKALSYPVNATQISEEFAAVPQAGELSIRFSLFQPLCTKRGREKPYPVFEARRSGVSAGWSLLVWSVPSGVSHEIEELLAAEGFARVKAWLRAKARTRHTGLRFAVEYNQARRDFTYNEQIGQPGCGSERADCAPVASAALLAARHCAASLAKRMNDATIYGKSVYLADLSGSRRTDYFKRDFELQSPEQKVFSAIWELESQVSNGGFHGYLANGAQMSQYVPTALRTIGAAQCAAIVEEALGLIPASFPADLWQRWTAVRTTPLAEQLDSLNKRYFDAQQSVIALLYAFVAAHSQIFGPTPPEESLPRPPQPPTPGEIDATLRSLTDTLQGGPEAILKMAGSSVPLEELDPEMQRLTTDLAADLGRIVKEFREKQRKDAGEGDGAGESKS